MQLIRHPGITLAIAASLALIGCDQKEEPKPRPVAEAPAPATPAPPPPPPEVSVITSRVAPIADDALAKAKGCLACHQVDKKVVGPAYKEVAKKYAGQAGMDKKLAETIMKGSKGTWGNVAMPPNKVTPEEAEKLAKWVLSLK